MSTQRLKKLSVAHLRGATTPFVLDFETDKKMTIIYGENANGKSTICDAFEFLGKGKVGSLENRGLGKTQSYWPCVGKMPGDVSVILEDAGGSCAGRIVKNEVVATPPELRPKVEVLRRSQILSLIEAQPTERYTRIKEFIDISNIETAENGLRDAIKDLKKGRDAAVARVEENQRILASFWETSGAKDKSYLEWAEVEVKRDQKVLDKEIIEIRSLCDAYTVLKKKPESIDVLNKSVDKAKSDAALVQAQLTEALKSVAADSKDIIEILNAATGYFGQHPSPAVCPLCESSDRAEGLVQRTAERIKQFSVITDINKRKIQADRAVNDAEVRLKASGDSAIASIKHFNELLASGALPKELSRPTVAVSQNIELLPGWLQQNDKILEEWKQAEVQRQDKKQFFVTLQKALTIYKENKAKQVELDVLIPLLEKALGIIESERKSFTDGILSQISTEIGRLYEIIHPGEGLAKITVELDAAKRAALEIGTEFYGLSKAPPQAYFSDSHLDTLGLCVFMALSSMSNQAETILVLDDVLASADEPHVEKTVDMLYDEAEKYRHAIIATHYRPWREKLRWGWLKNNQCQFIELRKWSLPAGLCHCKSIPEIDRLGALLVEAQPDVQAICSKAGVILEAILDFLTKTYQCKVPRRPDQLYTLGDLLPAVGKKLRDVLRIERQIGVGADGKPTYESIAIGPILDELTRIAQARNIFGCHFTEISLSFLDSDAMPFGQKVLELATCIVDKDQGWPGKKKAGSYWATAKESRRLYPLEEPR